MAGRMRMYRLWSIQCLFRACKTVFALCVLYCVSRRLGLGSTEVHEENAFQDLYFLL